MRYASIVIQIYVIMFCTQVAYTMCNLAYHSTDICQHLLDSGALPAMVPLLKSTDTDTVHLALSFTDMVLRDTENVSHFRVLVT